MPGKKIMDEQEVVRWLEEGRTYRWMSETYLTKYNLQVSPSMFSEYRSTHGLERRKVRDTQLIPWAVREEHRWDAILSNLRVEARVRAGTNPDALDYVRRTNWEAFKRELMATNTVVHYDPDTEQGFFFVPREEQDDDIIRRPPKAKRGRGRRD